MKRKNVSNKKRIKTAREEYYAQLNSEDAADREAFYINFYNRAVAENNHAFQDTIISDAALCWSMFQDEVRDFLNRRIGANVSQTAAA